MAPLRFEVIVDNDGDGIAEDNRHTDYDSTREPFSSIAKLYIDKQTPDGLLTFVGTGFWISSSAILTAAHNIYSDEDFDGYADKGTIAFENGHTLDFSQEHLVAALPWQTDADQLYDFGIIDLGESLAQTSPIQLRAIDESVLNERAYVAGYDLRQDIGEQHLHHGSVRHVSKDFIFYDVDTRDGQSGSPVLDENSNAIGIHAYAAEDVSQVTATILDYNAGVKLDNEKIHMIWQLTSKGSVGV